MAVLCAMLVLAWMAGLTAIDVRERRLPNNMTLPGAVLVAAGATVCGHGVPAALGALALAGGYLVIHLISPAAMGAGDVKLALGLGGLTGAFGVDVWALAALGAPVLTVAGALLSRRRMVPHGPSMCLATVLAVALVVSGR